MKIFPEKFFQNPNFKNFKTGTKNRSFGSPMDLRGWKSGIYAGRET